MKAGSLVPNKKQILLVDDHPIVRAGFSQILDHEADLQVAAQASNSAEAVRALEKQKLDLAIIDISLEGSNGVELLKLLQSLHPKLPVMMLSMHAESVYGLRCLRAGARGYLMKHAPTEELLRAIRHILSGGSYFSSALHELAANKAFNSRPKAAKHNSELDLLTDRELEVFTAIGQGKSTAVVAKQLKVSVKTVETHRMNIPRKFLHFFFGKMEALKTSPGNGI